MKLVKIIGYLVSALTALTYLIFIGLEFYASYKPRSYGEDLTGYGYIPLGFLMFFTALIGFIASEISKHFYKFIFKKELNIQYRLIIGSVTYLLISIPVFLFFYPYVQSDLS